MQEFLLILKNVIIFVLLAVPAYILVRGKILKESDSRVISKLLLYIGLPFLIFDSVAKVDLSGKNTIIFILIFIFGVLFPMLCVWISSFFYRKDENKKARGIARFCMAFANNGFLGIPLATMVFGADSIITACIIVLNITSNSLMYIFGPSLAAGEKQKTSLLKVILNPGIIAFVIGIIVNLTKLGTLLPQISTYAGYFSGIVTPVSMLILGMKMAAMPVTKLFLNKKVYTVCLMKLIVFPVIASVLGMLLMKLGLFDRSMVIAVYIAYAMPTAGSASAFADRHDGDGDGAAAYTLGTTIFCIATVPLLYLLLQYCI